MRLLKINVYWSVPAYHRICGEAFYKAEITLV